MGPRAARAVLFDLDGTLVDSEVHTDQAITDVLARYGAADAALPPEETRGRTWADVSVTLVARYRVDVSPAALADELLARWIELAENVQEIPGSAAAVRGAASRLALAVVSSSPRAVIDSFLAKLGVADVIAPDARIGAESVTRTKPDPEGYLLGARRLGVDPSSCVVFEDSNAGLLAARAAGMRSVFVLHRAANVGENRALADAVCTHYGALPAGFWEDLAAGAIELSGRSFL